MYNSQKDQYLPPCKYKKIVENVYTFLHTNELFKHRQKNKGVDS